MALFDSKNNKLDKRLKEIKELISKYQDLELSDFKVITERFRKELENGKTEEELLSDAYALIYCAFNKLDQKRVKENNESRQAYNYYDCQLKTSIALNDGDLVQMLTGEGKTYALTPSAYLNAISGKGVYVITANEYLVERDCNENKELFELLGLNTKYVSENMDDKEKKEGYDADITYVTASTAAFDYLRDNQVKKYEDKIQRGFNYAIIDELDSILIDDANTPFIISEKQNESKKNYILARRIVEEIKKYSKASGENKIIKINEPLNNIDKYDLAILELNKYLIYSEADQEIFITKDGIRVIDNILSKYGYEAEKIKVDNEEKEIYPYEQLSKYIQDAFRVEFLMEKDIDYTVVNNEIKLIDKNLGRISENSKYSNGIHQALEAKEGLEISAGQISTAFINQPNFFSMFKKVSGLSGTLLESKKELKEVYGKDIVEMKPNKDLKRIDYETEISSTKSEKEKLIIKEILKNHKLGRPILLGTESIEECEYYSEVLDSYNIKHNTLHAKNSLEEEAKIIKNAGNFGEITITTAIAGRGTDIKLDKKSIEVGGLCVIGTSYSNSKRIDDQLRGRAGRQGEQGSSKFIISLEDSIFKNNCNETIIKKVKQFCNTGLKPKVRSFVNSIQKKVTLNEEANRKKQNEIMSIDDKIRRNYYMQRDEVLKSNNAKKLLQDILQISVKNNIEMLKNGEISIDDFKNRFKDSIISNDAIPLLNESLNKNNVKKLTIIMQKNVQKIMPIYNNKSEDEIRKIILDLSDSYYTDFINTDIDRKLEASLLQYSGQQYDISYVNNSFNKWNLYMKNMQNELLYNACTTYKEKNVINEEVKDNNDNLIQNNSKINYDKLTKKEIFIIIAKAINSKDEKNIITAKEVIFNNKIFNEQEKEYFLKKLPKIEKISSSNYTNILNRIKYNISSKNELDELKKEISIIYDTLSEEEKKQINLYLNELENKVDLENNIKTNK